MVFFLHIGTCITHNQNLPVRLRSIFTHGGDGVTIFFVLSGFILTYTYRKQFVESRFDWKSYAVNRFARIYPLYAFSLILFLPALIGIVTTGGKVYSQTEWATIVFTRFSVLHAWYPPVNISVPWLNQGWTLTVEFFFYLCFPFIAPKLLNVARNKFWIWFVGLFLLASVPRYVFVHHFGFENVEWTLLFPPFRLAEFAIGILVGKVYLEKPHSNTTYGLSALTGALLIVSSFITNYGNSIHWESFVPIIGAAFLIFGLAGWEGKYSKFLSNPTMVLLGESSYALYLIHGLSNVIFTAPLYKLTGIHSKDNFWAFLGSFAFTIGVSIVLFKFVEEPARKAIRNRFQKSRLPANQIGTPNESGAKANG